MAVAQMTTAASSGVFLLSFEGLRSSTVKASSFSFRMGGGLDLGSTPGLVVKAATTVAPKVFRFPKNTQFSGRFSENRKRKKIEKDEICEKGSNGWVSTI